MTIRCRPRFLCIGAQKAGTTWLYSNLETHPEVWMPPVKEMHYFNRVIPNERLSGKWDLPHPHGIVKRYFYNANTGRLRNIKWLREYYKYGESREWYLGLFGDKYTHGKISGDITPAYSTLDDNGVQYAKDVLGSDTPILLILRNPIERSWSAAKMMFRYLNKEYSSNNYEEIRKYLEDPNVTLRSDYANIIRLWQKYFMQVSILTYDELCREPMGFLSKISAVINIQDTWDNDIVSKRIWSDESASPIPADISDLLRDQYCNQFDELYSQTGIQDIQQWKADEGCV